MRGSTRRAGADPPPTSARRRAALLRETARHLAVRMSYEDVIRVRQAKIDPARLARIASEIGAKASEPFTVTEFLKPGIDEMCSILPPALATRILAVADRAVGAPRALGHGGQHRSVSGFLRFLAARQAAPLAAALLPLPGRAARHRHCSA
jgi:indolepyruvate ferredoxin oxidoreductase beta subunit